MSTESTLKNVDNTAKRPSFTDGRYILTEYAQDNKYGFDPDYPVNIGFIHDKQETINITYYFNALEGPNGEKISFKKQVPFTEFITYKPDKIFVIYTFLAILELLQLSLVTIIIGDGYNNFWVEKTEPIAAA